MQSVDEVQGRLPTALAANRPGSETDHVVVALPSYSLGESLLSHYADRIPALEHRYLVSTLLLGRLHRCHLVFVASQRPEAEVLDYYASLLPHAGRRALRERLNVIEVPDRSARAVAAKLLDRPDLISDMRRLIAGRTALIEPWNVTEVEEKVSRALGVAINGTPSRLWSLGFKSSGRRLFREAGVPVPAGVEDVRSVDDVARAVDRIRLESPGLKSVIVKLDDSGAGDGNVVLDVDGGSLREALARLPTWYLSDLAAGGVVEERVTGVRFASPSAQIDVLPGGDVVVLATHEQVLGGPGGQVYTGCRFPADRAYAPLVARYAAATGRMLAGRGVLGRASIDFTAAQDAAGRWAVRALEVNLRKGGTTHPYTVLRNLLPGRYAVEAGCWRTDDGRSRSYSSTDNLVDPAWTGLPPRVVIRAVHASGLGFEPARGTGVVLHMLSGLAIDGRFGLTAIGKDAEEAEQLHTATQEAVASAATGFHGGARGFGAS
jgi:PGM1 C-terminal domain